MLVNAEGKSPSKVWATYLGFPQLWKEDEVWLLCSRWKGDYLQLLQEENKGEQSLGCTWALSWVTFWLVHYVYFFPGMPKPIGCLCYHHLGPHYTHLGGRLLPISLSTWLVFINVCIRLGQTPAGQVLGESDLGLLVDGSSGHLATRDDRDGIVQLTGILGCTIRKQPFVCHIFI